MRPASLRPIVTILLFAILQASVSRPGICASDDLTIEEIVRKAAPSVVTIEVFDRAGDLVGGGTGFLAGPNKVLTNAHVIEGCHSLKVIRTAPTRIEDPQPRILKMDEEVDLALLEVSGLESDPLEFASGIEIGPGRPVVAFGNDYRGERLVSAGIVRACLSHKNIISAAIHAGHSGSPLFDMQGQVVGVCASCFRPEQGEKLNLAINLATIDEFMASPDAPVDLPVAGTSSFLAGALKGTAGFFGGLFNLVMGLGAILFRIYLIVATVLVLGVFVVRTALTMTKTFKAYLAFTFSLLALSTVTFSGLLAFLALINEGPTKETAQYMIILVLSAPVYYFTARYHRRNKPVRPPIGGHNPRPLI